MNNTKTFTTMGSSQHSKYEREANDYYATHPNSIKLLLKEETFNINILEPSCGEGHMSNELEDDFYCVTSYDLIDRGYGQQKDFFTINSWHGDIITNPPYSLAKEFVWHSLDIVEPGAKIAMFLKLTFMETKGRKKLFIDNPPKTIYVSSSRIICAKNGDFEIVKGSAIAYAWYIWEKGFKGNTTLKWIN